jgi:hypothetical protein
MKKNNKQHTRKIIIFISIIILIGLAVFYYLNYENKKFRQRFSSVSGFSIEEVSFLEEQGFIDEKIIRQEQNLSNLNLKSSFLIEQNFESDSENFEVLATKLDIDNNTYRIAFKLENKSDKDKDFYLVSVSESNQTEFKHIKGVVKNGKAKWGEQGDWGYDIDKHKQDLIPELAQAYDDIENNKYEGKPIKLTLTPNSYLIAQSEWNINENNAFSNLKPVYFLIYGSAGGVKDELTTNNEHWVYIETNNKSGVTLEDDKGRGKKGDIIDILPVSEQYTPSETEKKAWTIIRVKGLTKEDIDLYTSEWEDKAQRRYKVDIDSLNLEKGLYENVIDVFSIKPYITQKTNQDLISYRKEQRIYAFWRPLRLFKNKLIPIVRAETISTVNKVGEDYNTITLWEDDKDGDLAGDNRQETCEVYDDQGDLDEEPEINGSTTNATYYMKITSPEGERHSGTVASGAANDSSGNWFPSFRLEDDFTVLEWLIISKQDVLNDPIAVMWIESASNVTVQNNIVYNPDAAPLGGIILEFGVTGTNKIYNNIVYDMNGDGIRNSTWGGLSTLNVYNNTVYNCADGIEEAANSTFNAINNISDSNGGDDYKGNFDTDTDNLDTADNVVFENEGTDFHLHSSDTAARDQGTDNGTEANVDIDGRDRDTEGDTWDIGADEATPNTGILEIKGDAGGLRFEGGIRFK